MHVLVTADTVGGVWTYTRELVTGLVRRGVRVTLVSFGEVPSVEQTDWMGGLETFDYRPTGFRLEWMQDCEDDLACSAEYLLSVIDEVRPDLLHLSQFFYGTLACRVPRIVVAHSDVLGWWKAVHGCAPKPSAWIGKYREFVRAGLHDADAVVAPTQWMLNSLERSYGTLRNGSVIHNGRAPEQFNPYMTKEQFAVSAGRIWDLGKNAVLLTQVDSKWLIYLAGENTSPEQGATWPTALHTGAGRVVFKGPQTDRQLRHLMARASVYVATSRYEPFGLAPLEAALSRCAIVASDIPSFREIWGDSICYFESNNPASLRHELDRLASDKELCTTYGRRAYEHARTHYKSSQMVEDYLNLYHTLVSTEALAA